MYEDDNRKTIVLFCITFRIGPTILQSIYLSQDVLQDESFRLDESFTNSFINELSRVSFTCVRLCHWLTEFTVLIIEAVDRTKKHATEPLIEKRSRICGVKLNKI